ncbi:uncharacterized protein CC84DRAFT_486242 [Paraphaeosphaeria sporulosa]|uniref:Uncharacterized protein n=1 Tax=Paraphaeosphaeria sporulosa TaxID=1460663 RepID=A0A177CU00_9PLEO|nr:uncharacterized protein CC84DRAFT_486242 [Paraphaeosphaeria sporulosa]OAG10488.1 hypothetical protein CC84DRAFT_486242 [Paraphaeosphaeria sporulosa]
MTAVKRVRIYELVRSRQWLCTFTALFDPLPSHAPNMQSWPKPVPLSPGRPSLCTGFEASCAFAIREKFNGDSP